MTARVGAPPPPAPPAAAAPGASKAERLRGVARQLEGVFVEQMFKAMRETVPEDGAISGGSGEAMFTGMLDQSLAEEVPGRWSNGLAEALYRQLQRAAGIEGPEPGTGNQAPGPGNQGTGPGPWSLVPGSSSSSAAAPVPILDGASSTSAASARAVLPESQ